MVFLEAQILSPTACVQILAQPLAHSVTLSKWILLSVCFFICKARIKIGVTHRAFGRLNAYHILSTRSNIIQKKRFYMPTNHKLTDYTCADISAISKMI